MSKRPYDEPYGSSHKRQNRGEQHTNRRFEQQPRQSSQNNHQNRAGLGYNSSNAANASGGGNNHPPSTTRPSADNSHSKQQPPKDVKKKPAHTKTEMSYEQAARELPPLLYPLPAVPAYTPFIVNPGIPELPTVAEWLAKAPFRHKSALGNDRTTSDRTTSLGDGSYERLEFMGDAYIQLIATRLINHAYSHLTAGNQSQVREFLVKNETLAEFARTYKFDDRLNSFDHTVLREAEKNRGSKGTTKIMGDVLEAYAAAVIMSDVDNGFLVAEKWLTALWAPKLTEHVRTHFSLQAPIAITGDVDVLKDYDPTAKATLQQKILALNVKLDYEPYQDSEELKGETLGQNRHYIAVYLTGWGYERQLLGQGIGKNKVEAGNWAAARALHGECRDIVEACAAKLTAIREARKLEKAEQEAAEKEAQTEAQEKKA